jgi:uncharacterized membrane protein
MYFDQAPSVRLLVEPNPRCRGGVNFLIAWRVVAFIVIVSLALVNLYEHRVHGLPWFMYATSIAVLLCVSYLFCVLMFTMLAPFRLEPLGQDESTEAGKQQEPSPYTPWARYFFRAAFISHTLGMPCITYVLIIYERTLVNWENSGGVRINERAMLATTFSLMCINFLLSATPMKLEHIVWTIVGVALYLALIGIIQAIENNGQIYPWSTLLDGIIVLLLCSGVHLMLFAVQAIKERLCKA